MAMLALTLCTSKKCGQPGCRGLQKNIEFDIHIEKEDCFKNSNLSSSPVKKGLFELPKDLHRGLEVELKKIAPVNGRVIMDFRARCGCPAVRIEVSGPKKRNRKKMTTEVSETCTGGCLRRDFRQRSGGISGTANALLNPGFHGILNSRNLRDVSSIGSGRSDEG
ncbi:ribosomal protein L34e superfamily protein [Tanacetum coccineum]